MRRTARLTTVLSASLLIGGLAACGSGDEEPAAEGSSSSGGAFPVTIDHIWGSTTVEEAPERVVALGVTDSDPLLALGVVPVAVQPFSFYAEAGVGPWAEEYLDGTELTVLDPTAEVSVEEVAALEPDLIVGIPAGFDETVYEQLSQVAPTLVRPGGTAAYGVGRDDATRMVAQALGKEAAVEEPIDTANAAFDEAVAANPQFEGATGAVLLPFSGVYGAYLRADARGQIMDQLGFAVPEGILAEDTGDSFYVELSSERIDLADGDVLVVLTDEAGAPIVAGDTVLQGLPVVTAGGLILPEADLRGAMSYNTVLSAPFAVEQLSPLLVDALAATTAA